MRAVPLLFICAVACAGSGKRYPCDPSVGDCGGVENPDGGIQQTPFISDSTLVWHDGAHNGHTDVQPFAGALFSVFRHGAAWSGDATAQLYVARSADQGKTWTKAAALSVTSRDPREPKLFLFGGKLWVIATFWDTNDPTAHVTTVRVSSSADGVTWTAFSLLPSGAGMSAWRPRLFGKPTAFALLSTSDAASFASTAAAPVGLGAREGELIVRATGERWLAVPERTVGASLAKQTFCSAPAASLNWTCWSVAVEPIESPAMFEWQGVLFVAGKRDTGNGFKRTSLWQVVDSTRDLTPVADVPSSFGDTGGPAVAQLDADNFLLTFHTTSKLDPKVIALGHEPTEVEAQAQDYAGDVLAVDLYMPSAAAGH